MPTPFAGGGFLGSGGKVQTSQTTQNTIASTGYGALEGDQSQLIAGLTAGDGATINITDQGAFQGALGLALTSLDLAGGVIGDALTGLNRVVERTSSDTRSLAESLNRSETERSAGEFRKLVTVVAIALAAVFVLPAIVPALKKG